MVELFAAVTGVELGKLVLEQVLNLGKSALEDYVKDFFKDCLGSAVARANAGTLKKPMAEAIGFFIKRFIKELQLLDVPQTSIDHHFKITIKRFVQDKAVRPILGKAFQKDCNQIDYAQLQQIWTQQYQTAEWKFPTEDFDWRRVTKEYVLEVKDIIKADAELRSILNTQLLEDIAHNTAQISPGFDVDKYRESLQCSYGYLKLYTLDSTDRADTIKLWNMFIEQTVREALPPTRYELPLDLKRQLQEQGQLDDLSPEALEHYRREYFQQPARKVLEAVAEARHAVILGDPGSGKSTLLQYLALDWVEGKTETLPLLIELREYVMAQSASFLDFLHRGRGADWQFDERQLHQYLSENPSLVMFDGLDEVFARPTQAAIVDDMIRFAQQYPQAKVLVTSRIIGYNPERFQHAGFRQFTVQSLDKDEIHEFIDRWYDLAMGSDSDKMRLKQRLKDAIDNSKAIANLADNPLLLTMMAILNRRQELPCDRADLYDQASRVLLYHWDVDHKRLQLPMDAIGRREKQEMLRLIAYEMQAGEEGLKGNLIRVDRLTRILTDYLHNQGFSEPREKANLLIQQLRERNFILCYRGADAYGFVHRTFLEYFCAVEIKERFDKRGLPGGVTFEKLRDEIFGNHWQDETWHEVLALTCGNINAKFVGQLIEFLLNLDGNLLRIYLAVDCLVEVSDRSFILDVDRKLFEKVKELTTRSQRKWVRSRAVECMAKGWSGDPQALEWLLFCVKEGEHPVVLSSLIPGIASKWRDNSETITNLKEFSQSHSDALIRDLSIRELAKGWHDQPDKLDLFNFLCERITHETFADSCSNTFVLGGNPKEAAIQSLVTYCSNRPETFNLLCDRVVADSGGYIRKISLETLLKTYPTHSKTLELLYDRAINDPDEQLREWAQQELEKLEQS